MPRIVRCLVLLLILPNVVYAKPQNGPRSLPPSSGFHAEFVANLDDVESKILQLAGATSAAQFTWRPAPGVRSISEAYMHIAGANYFLASFLGAEAPRMTPDLEKTVTRKDDVVRELKKSFAHLRAAAAATRNLDATVKMFGRTTTHRGVMLTALSHLHEHLGQSVAYARMNGITPPWSR